MNTGLLATDECHITLGIKLNLQSRNQDAFFKKYGPKSFQTNNHAFKDF